MEKEKIQEIVAQLTLEEKASLCSGEDFWHTKAIERVGIPAMMLSDGPFGLRKQEIGGDAIGAVESITAVCFPAGVNSASSFDRELVYKLGATLGEECQAEGVSVLLGPAINIKRSPLCGRNFEYYSEDPYVSSQIAEAYIKGLQSKGVGACLKHFYANNMEKNRMTSSSELDERTAREIYLASFEHAIKEAKPWSIMCAYNRINGVFAAQNYEALTDILRKEWGFNGFVVSDWGATDDRVADIVAGMDLEMPGAKGINDKKIVKAIQDGYLSEAVLDETCMHILDCVFRSQEKHKDDVTWDLERDHFIAREMAAETMVLLKNDGILPLQEEQRVAFIGQYAKKPRYQGGGSSHINSFCVEAAMDMLPENANVSYAQGYIDSIDETDENLLIEARRVAQEAEVAVLFVGLPDIYESEAYDRKHMQLPPNQLHLIEEVCKVQNKVVLVLHNGSPIEMPFIHKVNAVLESYLAGQGVGGAQIDILYGKVNPSAKLAETFPIRLQDTPTYLNFQVEKGKVYYREGLFVGYRYYDTKNMSVLFPFGHGLSYTTYRYKNMRIDKKKMSEEDSVRVFVDVTNEGKRSGKEIVFCFVAPTLEDVIRPVKELKGFEKIELMPGETKTVEFVLDKRAFAYWDEDIHDWFISGGNYGIEIGSSVEDIRLRDNIELEGSPLRKMQYTLNHSIGEILKNPDKAMILEALLQGKSDNGKKKSDEKKKESSANQVLNARAQQEMFLAMPLRSLISFGGVNEEMIMQLLDKLNS